MKQPSADKRQRSPKTGSRKKPPHFENQAERVFFLVRRLVLALQYLALVVSLYLAFLFIVGSFHGFTDANLEMLMALLRFSAGMVLVLATGSVGLAVFALVRRYRVSIFAWLGTFLCGILAYILLFAFSSLRYLLGGLEHLS